MEITIRDMTIFYESRGEGRPILFLHGSPTDHVTMLTSYEPVFTETKGWHRIYVDLPGMGNTSGADWIQGNDDIVDLMAELLQAIAPNQDFAVVGFSYGGYIARALAYRQAERCIGLMLLAPAITSRSEGRTVPEKNIIVKNPELFEDVPEQIRPIFESAIAVQTEYVVERSKKEILPAILKADHDFLARIRPNFRVSYADEMNQAIFDKPSLFLLGRQDTVTGYFDAMMLHDRYPRASIVILDRCGHGPQMPQQELFEMLTSEWLFRVEEMLEEK